MTKMKALLLTMSAGAITLAGLGGCWQFWGDVFGDALWLGGID